MATKTVEEQAPERPTRDDIKAAVIWIAEHTNRIPTLWGPTACGKTWLAADIAEERGAKLVTVLCQQHTPDEIAGFQTIVGDKLVAQTPCWFDDAENALAEGTPVVLLFDELGLARDEVRGSLYTFFRDRHIRGHRLEGDVMVMAATNPAVLAPPYRSRCCLIPMPAEREYLLSFASNRYAKLAAEVGNLTFEGDPAFSNEPPPAPAIVEAAGIAALNAVGRALFELTEPSRRLIIESLVPPAVSQQVLDMAHGGIGSVQALLDDPSRLVRTIPGMATPDAVTLSIALIESFDSIGGEQAAKVLAELLFGLYGNAETLAAYFDAPGSDRVVKALEKIDPEAFSKHIEGRIAFEGDKFTGEMIEVLEAQVEVENE